MSTNPAIKLILPLLMVIGVATAAYSGGWATITLSEFPDYSVAGKPLQLTFTVRQHGQTMLSGLKPIVQATSKGGGLAKASVAAGRLPGEYSASLTLPQPGDWTIKIDSGFGASSVTLPLLKAIADGSPAPMAFSPATRGMRLFTAKGCTGCHTHLEVNLPAGTPARPADSPLNLTGKRFQSDYLKSFLADPSIRGVEMPNLKLSALEIDALAAFINKSSQKKDFAK